MFTDNPVLTSITVSDFKGLFTRDFPYLPLWLDSKTYNAGAEVYYNVTELFYKSKSNGVTSIPTTIADWELVADDINNYILDSDIEKAFNEASAVINPALATNDNILKMLFLYLSAHFLVLDIRTSLQGVQSKGEFSVTSKSVGSVSESYGIPDSYMKDPILNYYTKTNYGLKYLSIVVPLLRGNVAAVDGWTMP